MKKSHLFSMKTTCSFVLANALIYLDSLSLPARIKQNIRSIRDYAFSGCFSDRGIVIIEPFSSIFSISSVVTKSKITIVICNSIQIVEEFSLRRIGGAFYKRFFLYSKGRSSWTCIGSSFSSSSFSSSSISGSSISGSSISGSSISGSSISGSSISGSRNSRFYFFLFLLICFGFNFFFFANIFNITLLRSCCTLSIISRGIHHHLIILTRLEYGVRFFRLLNIVCIFSTQLFLDLIQNRLAWNIRFD